MNHINKKDFFKAIKKESKEYSDDMAEGFPYFCLKIFWDSLSKDDIENALDGLMTNDESIDAFFIDEENREIIFLQCKSCESENQIRALKKEWLSFLDGIENKLEDSEFIDNHTNERLKEIAKEYLISKKKGFKPKKFFFHLGHANKNIIQHYDGKISYFDYNKIKEEYQEYLSKMDRTEPPEIEIKLDFDIIEPKISQKHKTLVSIITGDELINLREKYRYKLFDKNLRFGLGQNKINKGIINTAIAEPNNFYFFNNGITITSKGFKYKQTNNKLRIKYPQIINGAQTVNALYEAFKQRENKLSRDNKKEAREDAKKEFNDIKILFRIIQDAEKDGKKTSLFEDKVIRFNNSQNSVKETDFYANYPEQIRLQELFAQYGYFYEIKRGDRKYLDSGKDVHNLLKKKKKDFEFWEEKIDIEKIASLWMAYQLDPTADKVRKANIFGYAQDKYYDILFKNEEFDEKDVKEMILAFHLFGIIVSQAEIYGNTVKKGQIISKISRIKKGNEKSEKTFENIKQIIQGSIFLAKTLKNDCETIDKFFANKDSLLDIIKENHFFSQGRYLTLAIFALIIKECNYLESIIGTDLFNNKKFIKDRIVEPWLKIILNYLIKEEYVEFYKETGSSIKTFYARVSTWENIQNKFKKLKYKLDKEFTEIFPLSLS